MPYILPPAAPAPRFFHALNQRVSLVKLIPGLSPAYLAFALAESDGVLVESFGVGGVPAGDQGQFYDLIPPGGGPGKDRGGDHPGAERGQRPGGVQCGSPPPSGTWGCWSPMT